jgi:hypothetical protein
MASDITSVAAKYEDLIRDNIGSPDEVLHIDPKLQLPDTPEIDVYLFLARSARYSLLVTAGASSQPMPGVTDDWPLPKRIELYCKLNAKIDEPPDINAVATRLWMAAQFPFRGKRHPLGYWHLHGDLPPFAERSELTAWMFSPPLTEDTPVQRYQFAISEKVGKAALIQATGITEAERAVGEKMAKRDRTLERFAEELFKRSGSYTHTNRASVDLTDLLGEAPPGCGPR